MLSIQLLREEGPQVIGRLQKRNFDATGLVNGILELDKERRHLQAKNDALLAEANNLAKTIGDLVRQGKKEEAESLRNRSAESKETSRKLGEQLTAIDAKLQEKLVEIPNIPHTSVPAGKSAEDNEVVREGGSKPDLPADAQAHWDLAEKYRIIDFALGNKITGAGFPVYIGKGARLQRALINFFLDKALQAGYKEYQPPILVNTDSAFGTGQLPDKEGQMYIAERDELYLIPTAEVPLTNLYRDVILHPSDLPVKMVGYTPCFRREAGSYGKDVRGLNRLHQFDKVEIVQVRTPEESYTALEEMVHYVESLLQALQLPYRVLRLCGGDMGFTSALTYDMEVFSAAQNRWLEVSSISNFESYQAQRLKLRYKVDKKNITLHTLNGSALALPRIVAALLENNQGNNGIAIPEALQPYTGFDRIN